MEIVTCSSDSMDFTFDITSVKFPASTTNAWGLHSFCKLFCDFWKDHKEKGLAWKVESILRKYGRLWLLNSVPFVKGLASNWGRWKTRKENSRERQRSPEKSKLNPIALFGLDKTRSLQNVAPTRKYMYMYLIVLHEIYAFLVSRELILQLNNLNLLRSFSNLLLELKRSFSCPT